MNHSHRRTHTHTRGFTLVEVMLAATIALIAIAATLTVFISLTRSIHIVSEDVSTSTSHRYAQRILASDLRNTSQLIKDEPKEFKIKTIVSNNTEQEVSYIFDDQKETLTREVIGTGTKQIIMSELEDCKITYLMRTIDPINGTIALKANETPNNRDKVSAISIALTTRATIAGGKTSNPAFLIATYQMRRPGSIVATTP